jgi:hypothetical protein
MLAKQYAINLDNRLAAHYFDDGFSRLGQGGGEDGAALSVLANLGLGD